MVSYHGVTSNLSTLSTLLIGFGDPTVLAGTSGKLVDSILATMDLAHPQLRLYLTSGLPGIFPTVLPVVCWSCGTGPAFFRQLLFGSGDPTVSSGTSGELVVPISAHIDLAYLQLRPLQPRDCCGLTTLLTPISNSPTSV